MNGKLIVIDGLDGSGKQTQTLKLYERLKDENYKVYKTSFPNYESKTGEIVKMYLSGKFGGVDDVNAYQGSIPYAMDRYVSFINDEWGRKYREGYLIICDRYTTSNLIHQGTKVSNEELINYINWLKDLEYKKLNIPIPDDVLYLDVPIEVSENLIKNRLNKFTNQKELDIHERNLDYLRKCYYITQKISKLEDWNVIDCTQNSEMLSIDDIHEKIYQKVLKRL